VLQVQQFPLPISGSCFAFSCPNISLAGTDTFLCAFRGAPLPSIAQWISGLFGNVDLAPSDITAALVLAAAAQRRRRKNRIKKALNPIMKAASNAATSNTTDQVSDLDTASVDEREWLLAVLACCLHSWFPIWAVFWLSVAASVIIVPHTMQAVIQYFTLCCQCSDRDSILSGRPCLPPHAKLNSFPHVIR